MPATEIAPGITIYVPGKLPTVEDSLAAVQSLANPRTCTCLATKIGTYAKASNLNNSAFMNSTIHAFESPKMVAEIFQATARLQLTLLDLTLAQLETVLKVAFIKPHDFLDQLEVNNYVLPKARCDSQEELIHCMTTSFSSAFKTFCFLNSQFKELTDWKIPKAPTGNNFSTLARDAAISNFKDTLDAAWDLHISAIADRNLDINSAIEATLSKCLAADSRKRGLSTTSHVAQLPEPKHNNNFASNTHHNVQRPVPLMSNVSKVNTINYSSVLAFINHEIARKGMRNVTLGDLESKLNHYFTNAWPTAATVPNNIPVTSHVNTVPAPAAYILPDSSYKGGLGAQDSGPLTVNMICYTPTDMAHSYTSTGLPGVLLMLLMSTFDDSNDNPGYNNNYLNQPAPPPLSTAAIAIAPSSPPDAL
ncbi:hypothetical protein HDZ31DRAFT_68228 [Schizophyllum fasciatum]